MCMLRQADVLEHEVKQYIYIFMHMHVCLSVYVNVHVYIYRYIVNMFVQIYERRADSLSFA